MIILELLALLFVLVMVLGMLAQKEKVIAVGFLGLCAVGGIMYGLRMF